MFNIPAFAIQRKKHRPSPFTIDSPQADFFRTSSDDSL
jgi:hypothetical protein